MDSQVAEPRDIIFILAHGDIVLKEIWRQELIFYCQYGLISYDVDSTVFSS